MASIAGDMRAGRYVRIEAEGSAVTSRSNGSKEPASAPTFGTVRAPRSARWICAAMAGSTELDGFMAKYGAVSDQSSPVPPP